MSVCLSVCVHLHQKCVFGYGNCVIIVQGVLNCAFKIISSERPCVCMSVCVCVCVCVCADWVNTQFAIKFLSEMTSRQNCLQARAASEDYYTKSQ